MLVVSCGTGVVAPGNEMRCSLPEKTHTLSDAWHDGESILLSLGMPMAMDVYTEAHGISGSGIMVIDVRSHDFDPIAAVIDGQGSLVALCDDWKDSSNARIVLNGAPSGGRLLVFSPDDSRGLYDVVVREGTQQDLEAFSGAMDLSSGQVRGWMEAGSYNPVLETVLRESLEQNVYNYNYSQAQLFPFSLDGEELVSLSLESVEFDTYLVLVSVEDGSYGFVAYNDDYSGSDSRIISSLEAGDYLAVVMPYATGETGEFALRLEKMDSGALEASGVDAGEQGVEYSGMIREDASLALAWWPDMADSWEVPSFLDPFSPVAGFTFTVHEPSVYSLEARGEIDVCLTLLREQDGYMELAGSNDDNIDMGTDSRITGPLVPGEYTALVSAYSGGEGGPVTFSWRMEDSIIESLTPGRPVDAYAPYETPSLIYSLEAVPGRTYSISVESVDLDPVTTLYLPDGQSMYDDDGGEGTNSLLTFTPAPAQAGTCFLVVEKYSEGTGTFSILLEQQR
ncbi:MAG: hypothetical protein AVO35_06690 [Candidatus Aegiribacteria sp. MLS_C]|nr:MAG: hypothetical protein AVO35_06690 [Candidatus Aegiribacteria sp. MLS_C]